MEQPKNNLKIVANKKNARVILPNMLTLIGVCIGLTSIRFALDGRYEFAVIAITANSYRPSKANLIEVNPIQTPIKVSIFGKITRAFFLLATIFKLFLGCSIIIFLPIRFHLILFFALLLQVVNNFHNKHLHDFQT